MRIILEYPCTAKVQSIQKELHQSVRNQVVETNAVIEVNILRQIYQIY